MTKLVSVRATIPVGDDVTTEALVALVRASLETLQTPTVTETNREGDHRVHWSAVDVHRYVERVPGAQAVPRRRKPAAPATSESII
jgi:hypothetical protein